MRTYPSSEDVQGCFYWRIVGLYRKFRPKAFRWPNMFKTQRQATTTVRSLAKRMHFIYDTPMIVLEISIFSFKPVVYV